MSKYVLNYSIKYNIIFFLCLQKSFLNTDPNQFNFKREKKKLYLDIIANLQDNLHEYK